jgi:uncharacterized protein
MTNLRAIPPELDRSVVADIDARLSQAEHEHNVKLLLAIESGSRAWGFPSPDSDYDCRFVFARPRDDYLALFQKRDVIETPMTPVLDVNGWDLPKALRLLLNGNAVIIEWLTSPIIYQADSAFRDEFRALVDQVADRDRIALHYLHLGRGIVAKYLPDLANVTLKKVFYALRPAIALRWLRLNPTAKYAPMNFQQLCAGADLNPDLTAVIDELLAQKSQTREMGTGVLPTPINDIITSELDRASGNDTSREPIPESSIQLANSSYKRWADHQRE